MAEKFLEIENVDKRFSGVHALNAVSLSINRGEIHCLAGENGSGKSTLIKIVAGVVKPDAGSIGIGGRKFSALHPIDAIHAGIQVIYQDFSLFPNLTVAENLALNSQLDQRKRVVNWRGVRRVAEHALQNINVDIDLDRTVETLSVADKQLVAISRALLGNARLVIMDEPTTALTQKEVDRLFVIIKSMQERGIATLFVSHKLREVLAISERITILRNGQKIAEGPVADFDEPKIVYHMTGRSVTDQRFTFSNAGKQPVLEVRGLSRGREFRDIDFSLYPGEILGVTGLLGSGRTELALSLFGVKPAESGSITIAGKETPIRSISDGIAAGIAYVPEDRISEGLFLSQSISRNVIVSVLARLAKPSGLLDFAQADRIVDDWIHALNIATPDVTRPVQSLSGGNQQRVVLAKWLSTNARILILNGPTVGVDIGSKADIHEKLKELAAKGLALIVISDDIPELVQNCNRVLVMHKGRVVRELEGGEGGEGAISENGLLETLNGLD
ncbi:MAG: sugar ABC transporter ATP-binding protein [Propionivibrio sp.]